MLDIFAELGRIRLEKIPCVLVTVVKTAGSTPRKRAAHMVIFQTNTGIAISGTVGGGRIEKEVVDEATQLLLRAEKAEAKLVRYHLTHQLGMCCGGEMEIFFEPMIPAPQLLICGGGHVAKAVSPLAHSIGFSVAIAEEDEAWRSPERFPHADWFLSSFEPSEWPEIRYGANTFAIIVTRDHRQDQTLLEALLDKPLGYLGMIGSRRKVAFFRERLLAKGFSKESLDRVHMPIGLSIGAETPEEIAVAIVAELIRVKRENIEQQKQVAT